MAKWARTLRLEDVWDKWETDEQTSTEVQKLANVIADRLESLETLCDPFLDNTKARIIMNFRSISMDDTTDVDELDNAMEELYDWADTSLGLNHRVCWVRLV